MRDDLGWWTNRRNGLIVYILRGVISLFACHLIWACPRSNPVAPTNPLLGSHLGSTGSCQLARCNNELHKNHMVRIYFAMGLAGVERYSERSGRIGLVR